ncbi:MAG TPA: hypothetical protein VHP83_00010 [Aggregatilineaceae bacterium]|nr:hypothetical protein [Aggregatilineaceae bacterium]
MGENRSIFSNEWRDCLRAHYRYVIRSQDTLTEQTLRHVLLQTGMGEDELLELRREALGYIPEPEPDLAPAEESAESAEPAHAVVVDQAVPPAAAPQSEPQPPADTTFTDASPIDAVPAEDDQPTDPPPPPSSSQLSMF